MLNAVILSVGSFFMRTHKTKEEKGSEYMKLRRIGVLLVCLCLFMPLARASETLPAAATREEVEAYVARTQFTRFTEKTICDRAMFLKELEAIRERGYAVMNEEMAAHLVGVAAPVFNKEGYPRYAVSVAGLCFRPVEAFVAEVCDDVVQTAREISEFLAHARTMEDK